MSDYKVNFKDMKSRVGVDDIAYALGYRLDRKAGVGKYIELVLGEGNNRRDTLIVSHPHNKAAQTFFRRDGSKGDVVSLIRENLKSFLVSGKDDWQKIAKVMARFANMPEPEYREDREYIKSIKHDAVFDESRYEVKPIDTNKIPGLFSQRGISDDTVKELSSFISLVRDKQNGKFEGYNIGFPYTNEYSNEANGYEIRGYGGYKSKAAGTDSSSSAWVADLTGGNREAVRSVFFCESAFDAMAFYQMHGLRMMAILEDIPMKIYKKDGALSIEAKGKSFELNMERSLTAQVSEKLSIRYKMGQWLPPKAFKDWNDCLMNKLMVPMLFSHKEEREQNLTERRNTGLKM